MHKTEIHLFGVLFQIRNSLSYGSYGFSLLIGDGNIEFLIHLKWHCERENGENHSPVSIEQVVTEAHDVLKQKGKGE